MHLRGGTIAELKHRMSAAEFGRWIDFFNKYGRCGPVRMFDSGPALLAWRIDSVMGGTTKISDYIPRHSEERAATVEDIVNEFGVMKRG